MAAISSELPPSALMVLDHIASDGPMAPREISRRYDVPLRTVTFALKKLMKLKLLRKVPNLLDMRRPLYHLDKDRLSEMGQKIEMVRIQAGIHLRAI
jgi:DNA-binding MarR family transcriptional regulator